MPKKNKKLIIYGTGETADMAYEYFTHDSPYAVVGFTEEKKFLKAKKFHDLPVIAFTDVQKTNHLFIAISFAQKNQLRARIYTHAKKQGYTLASYISTRAFIWPTATIGDNAFILENNVIQHGVTIGNNVTLWSGNHVGHQTTIDHHVFISSHCVISGFCHIGAYSFLGVNSSYNDHITIAPKTVIGSGAVVIRDTEEGKTYVGNPAKPLG